MVRWGDVAQGLPAAARLMLRGAFWWTLICRALFSRVALAYLVVALLAGIGGYLVMRTEGAGAGAMVVLVLMLRVLPILSFIAVGLLIPYVFWVFQPAAVRFLSADLPLPVAEVADEPTFRSFVVWSLPAMAWLVLAVIASMFRPFLFVAGVFRPFLFYVLLAFAMLSLLKLSARTVLATYYARDTVARFLAATRWQRLLVWLPLLVVLGWTVDTALRAAAGLIGPGTPLGRGSLGGGLALYVLLNTLYTVFSGAAMAGTLLLACARSSDNADSVTQVLTRPLGSAPVAPRRPLAQRLGLTAAVLALVVGAAWVGRFHLVDIALRTDARYRDAAAHNQTRLGPDPALERATVRANLRQGLVAYACQGAADRADWLWKLGVQEPGDLQRVLACSACGDRLDGVLWAYDKDPGLDANLVVNPSGMPRTPLGCSASNNNRDMAAYLLHHKADPLLPEGRHSALNIAVQRRRVSMVQTLLGERPDGRAMLALEAAATADPRFARELLRTLAKGDLTPVRDGWGRTVLHWVAQQDDAEAAAVLPPALAAALRTESDRQGAQPWMHVLRRAQLGGAPVNLGLLQQLLPAQIDPEARPGAAPPGMPRALPADWNPAQAALNDASVRVVLGDALDYGRLSADPFEWWRFRDEAAAAAFVAELSTTQLLRAEQPEAPPGVTPQPLSAALEARGWQPLAAAVRATAARARR